ncbi:universal stress protein [Clostridium sp. cel8]|jgi:nucleotide-binding universal stress UspA family protein|uniref:universal stress protein n=1 Tax=unclassified Clostridium TaxID=2614128 RepID=UPI0015F4555F|nr:universal stress protein [Clostridium sp. cel8]MBA5850819.1 universal stress protein [Clostridium sp. cel8]
MEKKKLLVPLDGTDRSMHSLDWLKNVFKKDEVKITLMNVKEIVIANDMVVTNDEIKRVQLESENILNEAEKKLEGYEIEKYCAFGYAADEILLKAKRDDFDAVIMTKSTKKGLARMIGSVTSKVLRNIQTILIIVPE